MRHYRTRLIAAAAALLASVLAVTAFAVATAQHQARPPARSAKGLTAALRASAATSVVKPHPAKPSSDPSKSAAHGHGRGAGTTLASTTPSGPSGPGSGSNSGGINWGNPIYVDNFNGTSLNLDEWGRYDNPYGAAVSDTPYFMQSVSVGQGALNITGHYQAPYGYVGGGVESRINQTYGRWVVRFRADNGAGYEPAVLLWPEGTHADGEIDMAEVFPGSVMPVSTNRLGAGQFLHMLGAPSRFIGHKLATSVNFSDWQTLAVDWLPTGIQMYLNGTLTWSVSSANDRDFIPDTPFHLALQLEAGCTRGRCRPDSATPSQVVMQVDWIQIYAAPRG